MIDCSVWIKSLWVPKTLFFPALNWEKHEILIERRFWSFHFVFTAFFNILFKYPLWLWFMFIIWHNGTSTLSFGYKGTGTSWVWDKMGLVPWVWDMMVVGPKGADTLWVWDTVGLVCYGFGTQWDREWDAYGWPRWFWQWAAQLCHNCVWAVAQSLI